MTTGGLHILSGLFIASFIKDERYKKTKWGLVWGSVLPDIDLIASFVAFLLTRDVTLSSEVVHRSVTHGVFAIGIVLVLGLIISKTSVSHEKALQISIGLALGMTLHLILDMLDGYVAFLAPLTFEQYSLTGANLQESMGETYFKVWNAFDAISDSIAYLFIWYWSTRKLNLESEQKFAKKLRIVSIISIIYFGALLIIAFTAISFEIHYALIFVVYIMMVVPISTVLLHIKMKESIQEFSFFKLRTD